MRNKPLYFKTLSFEDVTTANVVYPANKKSDFFLDYSSIVQRVSLFTFEKKIFKPNLTEKKTVDNSTVSLTLICAIVNISICSFLIITTMLLSSIRGFCSLINTPF